MQSTVQQYSYMLKSVFHQQNWIHFHIIMHTINGGTQGMYKISLNPHVRLQPSS
jgi:hypothetical protein